MRAKVLDHVDNTLRVAKGCRGAWAVGNSQVTFYVRTGRRARRVFGPAGFFPGEMLATPSNARLQPLAAACSIWAQAHNSATCQTGLNDFLVAATPQGTRGMPATELCVHHVDKVAAGNTFNQW